MKFGDLLWTWNELGKEDPLWAILTRPDCKGGKWDPEEFFEIGRRDIARIDKILTGACPGLRRQRALDFGCGVGRLTQALGDCFDEVVGLDIAESMIAQARKFNRHGSRCSYVVNEREDLSQFEDASFDFVLSLLVLQHMPPEIAVSYLREFVRILRPDGVAFFQIPVATRKGETIAEPRKVPGEKPQMGVWCTPFEEVKAAFESAGGVLVLAEPSGGVKELVSYQVLVRRPATASEERVIEQGG